MKHLLNNISEEEKNRIREQHEGGMNLSIDNFKKLVETKLGDAKPYLTEASQETCEQCGGRIVEGECVEQCGFMGEELDESLGLKIKYLTIPEIESLAKEIVGKLDDNHKKLLRRLDVRNEKQRMILMNEILELVGVNTDQMGGGPQG
jgi:hypothetical protein